MSSKTAKIKASSIRIGWVASELGDIVAEIRSGNKTKVLDEHRYLNMAKSLMDTKKILNDICEEDDTLEA